MNRAAIACACCVLALTRPATAHAAPTARLIYGRASGAESCPDEAALRTAVSARVGYDPFFPYAARTVVVTMRGDDQHVTARIELFENERTNGRELTTRQGACDELLESAALAIAIAIDPRALIAPVQAPKPAPAPSAEAPVVSPPTGAIARRADDDNAPAAESSPAAQISPVNVPPRRSSRIRTLVGPRLASGLQPGAAPGIGVGGAIVWRRPSLGIEVESYLPTAATVASGSRVRAWTIDAALIPCWRFAPLSVCGVIKGGRFEATGDHVLDPRTDSGLFLAVGGRAGIEVPVSTVVSLHLDGELVGNLTPVTLHDGSETLWRAPPVAEMMALSASHDF